MDVNLSAEVKGFGAPAAPAVEREQKTKPQVTPVDSGGDSSKAALDEKSLHRQGAEVSAEDAGKMVKDIQDRLDSMGNRLNFSLREDPDTVVVQVTDRESGELVKQFPPEEVLALRQKLDELVGLLFDGKA
jgi:flagellar protein FlaG